MRQLLPAHPSSRDGDADRVSDDELAQLYAYPENRPWLRANMVASVDGAASAQGRSGGLSSPADRRLFALLRALADVILVGAGTAKAERYGPAEIDAVDADGRTARGQPPTPVIAVVSSRLDLDPELPLFREAHNRTIVLTAASAPEPRIAALSGVADVLIVGENRVDPKHAMDALVNRGLRRISCEGGPTLLAQIAADDLLDELCFTLSPLLLGGDAARITAGPFLEPPTGLRLDSVLAEDGSLFLRYLRRLEPGS